MRTSTAGKVENEVEEKTASIEPTSRQRARRIYWSVGACCVALLVAIVVILSPILVLQNQDRSAHLQSTIEERGAANDFCREFRNDLMAASSTTYMLAGFVARKMKTAPPFNASVQERVAGQCLEGFKDIVAYADSDSGNVVLMLLAPGGVINQMEPFVQGLYLKDILNSEFSSGSGFDDGDNTWTSDGDSGDDGSSNSPFYILAHSGSSCENMNSSRSVSLSPSVAQVSDDQQSSSTDCSVVNWPSPTQTIRCGGVSVLGPTRVVADAQLGPNWYINLRFPVFIGMNPLNSSTANFWGFVYSVLSITRAVENSRLEEEMERLHMNYLMYTMHDDRVVVISTSLPKRTRPEQFDAFIRSATVLPVIPNVSASWLLAVDSTRNESRLTTRVVLLIVLCTVVGVLGLLGLTIWFIIQYTAEYDGRRHAPKEAPFALLTVGPYNGKELWDLAADEMVAVTDRLNDVLDRAMVAFKAYRVQQMHPFTASFVLPNLEDAVAMSFRVLEETHKDRIDGPLVRLLGEEERLMLAFALNWCADASVVVKEGQPLLYSGPDVLFNARMWVFAAPNTVTLSGVAKQNLSQHRSRLGKGVRLRFLNSVFLRGVRNRQDLYNITDEANESVREAAQIAAARVRRMRDAQQRRHEERNRGLTHEKNDYNHSATSPLNPESSATHRLASFTRQSESDAALSSRVGLVNSGSSPRTGTGIVGYGSEHEQEMMRVAITSSLLGGAGVGSGPWRGGDGCSGGYVSGPLVDVLSESTHTGATGEGRGVGSGRGGGRGRSRLRQTRGNPLSVPHPLIYYPSSSSGAEPSESSRYTGTGRRQSDGAASFSRRSSNSGSSMDRETAAVNATVTPVPAPRSSTTSSLGDRSPVESELGVFVSDSSHRASLVGNLSGGLVVPTSVRSSHLLAAPPLPDAAVAVVPPAMQLQLESPLSTSDDDFMKAGASHMTFLAPSAIASAYPTLRSPDADAVHTARPSSSTRGSCTRTDSSGSQRINSSDKRAAADGRTTVITVQDSPAVALAPVPAFTNTNATTTSIKVADRVRAMVPPSLPGSATPRRTEAQAHTDQMCVQQVERPLPATVSMRADGRFMIAPPKTMRRAEYVQYQHLRDPLGPLPDLTSPFFATTGRRSSTASSLASSLVGVTPLSEEGEASPKAVRVPISQCASPMETMLSIMSTSAVRSCGGGGGGGSSSSSTTTTTTSHSTPCANPQCGPRQNPLSASTRSSRLGQDQDCENPLSRGSGAEAAEASIRLAPAFPIVVGSASARASSSGSSSRTGGAPPTPGDIAEMTTPAATTAVRMADGGGLAMAHSSLTSSTPATVTRRGHSNSHITNVTSSASPVLSSGARGADMVVPLLRAVTHPVIPPSLDDELRASFEQQSIALDVSYDSLRIVIYYVYFGCKLLMRPLSPAQRTSIYRRLVGNVSVPQQSALVYLSIRCVIQFVQQHEEQHSLLWDRQLQQAEGERELKGY